MSENKKVLVIYGSIRRAREGIKAARFIEKKLDERGFDVKLIDPIEYELPLLDKMYKEYGEGEAPDAMDKLGQLIKDADGFVIVSGEYNHNVPPALKNLLDHYQREYFFKPSAIATYSAGPFGGIRAGMQLRPILAELGMPSISTMFPISMVQNAFSDEGEETDPDMPYARRIKQFIDEFEWYVDALKEQRKKGIPY